MHQLVRLCACACSDQLTTKLEQLATGTVSHATRNGSALDLALALEGNDIDLVRSSLYDHEPSYDVLILGRNCGCSISELLDEGAEGGVNGQSPPVILIEGIDPCADEQGPSAAATASHDRVAAVIPPQVGTAELAAVLALAGRASAHARAHGRAENALCDQREELQQFAYAVSHDLQEPLRMVIGYLQLIDRRYRGQLDASADEFIEFAVDGARRMKTMIEDLLVYSRVHTRGGAIERCDLNAVVDRVRRQLGSRLETVGATIIIGDLPTIMGDRRQLQRLFRNLIENAIIYASESPRIRVAARRFDDDDDGWRITVDDAGIGIAPADRERVFGVFTQLHGREEYPSAGTGMGLAIARRIIERHGGTIRIVSPPSEPDAGERYRTRVAIHLPHDPLAYHMSASEPPL